MSSISETESSPEEMVKLQLDHINQVKKLLENFKKLNLERRTKSLFVQRMSKLDELGADFNTLHRKIVVSELTMEADYFKNETYAVFDEHHSTAYSHIATEFERLFPNMSSTNNPANAVPMINTNATLNTAVKLPKLTVPKFTGKYTDWQSFNDQYVRLIHSNTSLSNVEKFRYLREALPDDFDDDIRNIALTDANYTIAWTTLHNRYDNKRVMFTHYMNMLMSIPRIPRESSSALKSLKDIATSCIHGLGNLGIDFDDCSPLFVYFLVMKLPQQSHQLWEQELGNSTDIPEFSKFSEFLEVRYRILESWELVNKDNFKASNDNKQTSLSTSSKLHPNKSPSSSASFKRESKFNHTTINSNSTSKQKCIACSDAHILRRCTKFLSMDCFDRKNLAERSRLCFNCLSNSHTLPSCTSTRNCQQCGRRHHTLLHLPTSTSTTSNMSNDPSNIPATNTSAQSSPTHTTHISLKQIAINPISQFPCPTEVLLPTAIVKVLRDDGQFIFLRALIDQGSQGALITERAAQSLKTKRFAISSSIKLPAGQNTTGDFVTPITIQSCTDSHYKINVLACIIKSVTENLPAKPIQSFNWSHLSNLKLADPQFYRPRAIDLLLGANIYARAILPGLIKGNVNEPIAQKTAFGWIVSGDVFDSIPKNNTDSDISIRCSHAAMSLEGLVEKFYQHESIAEDQIYSAEEKWCEQYFKKTTLRQHDGKYMVRLPFKHLFDTTISLGKSRQSALNRFHSLERKFSQNADLHAQYSKAIQEYFTLNQIQPATTSEKHHITINEFNNQPNYTCFTLPHHAVMKITSQTTKCRVVFDASAKTSNGQSLNNILCTGPALQNDLPAILLNWRLYRYVFTADIEKMYRCIDMHPNDIEYQRMIWRDEHNEIRDYCLKTVTFGINSSPYLAIRILHQLAEDEKHNYPLAESCLKYEMYMDDNYSGAYTIQEALEIRNHLIQALKSAGFELRKWASNTTDLLVSIPTEDLSDSKALNWDNENTIKTLGMYWQPNADQFKFEINFDLDSTMTKRSILSTTAKLFDPLGLINPVIVTAKLILKRIWLTKVDWDTPISPELQKEWQTFLNELPQITNISIPRWLHYSSQNTRLIELHAFCDGSMQAYASIVYLRIQTDENEFFTHIITAKSKVTPAKNPLCIPRIELCAAVLNVKLVQWVLKHLQRNLSNITVYFWTDATIVLSWIRGDIHRWPIFVRNRISKIHSLSNINQWHHVTTNENPADISSRGSTPSQLLHSKLYWYGPQWLQEPKSNWPVSDWTFLDNEETTIPLHINAIFQHDSTFIEYYSSYHRLLRTTAYILRFRNNAQSKNRDQRKLEALSVLELIIAKKYLIRIVQEQSFPKEIQAVQNKIPVSNTSKLIGLTPFLDEFGILRILGRLQHSNLSYDEKHPMILPKDHHFTKLLIDNSHFFTLHGGIQMTSAHLRKHGVWIINTRRTVGSRLKKCVTCFRRKPVITTQVMGNLPIHRVDPPHRAFSAVGIDFTGAIELRASRYRGTTTYKGYIALFICLATKAVHLEAVTGMSTRDFLKALLRFTGRRGLCHDIYSDNGSNFIGANKEIKNEFIEFKAGIREDVIPILTTHGITWHFIPPYSPNFGGLWESNIKSAKYHLQRAVAGSYFTYEDLSTVLIGIESILNSRPLCPLNSDPDDLFVLTPGHFLIGDALNALPQPEVLEVSPSNRYLAIQRRVQEFRTHWSRAWLSHLQTRPKWQKQEENLNLNDMVIVKEDNLPNNQWLFGRIIQLHTGEDGKVRVVTVRTKTGNYKKAISKICKLPIQSSTDTD